MTAAARPERDPLAEIERRLGLSGSTGGDALDDLESRIAARGGRPVPAASPVDRRMASRREDITPIEDVALGVSKGLSDTGTAAARGLTMLFAATNPALAPQAFRVSQAIDRTERESAEYYDPQGVAGVAGNVAGRLTGEAVTALAGGRAVGNALVRMAPTSRVATAIAAGRAGTVGQRVAANTLPFVPVDAVMGAGGSDEGFVLPGRAGAAVESVAMGAVPAAGIEALVARRETAKAVGEALKMERARAAGDAAEAAFRTRVEEGAAGIRAASEARTARVAALEAEPPSTISRLTRAARDEQLAAAERSSRSAEIPRATAPAGADTRPMREILADFDATRSRKARDLVAADEADAALRASPADVETYRLNRDASAGARDRAPNAFGIGMQDVDDLTARRVGMPRDLQDDINLLSGERRWTRAVTTVGSDVRLENGVIGRVVLGAEDPVNGLGRRGKVLVEHEMDGQNVQRWYRATQIDAAPDTAFDFGENVSPSGLRLGSAAPEVIEALGGGAVGAVAGGTATGDTRGAAAGFVAGAGAPSAARALVRSRAGREAVEDVGIGAHPLSPRTRADYTARTPVSPGDVEQSRVAREAARVKREIEIGDLPPQPNPAEWGVRGRRGAASPSVVQPVGGAAVGAVAGATVGDTPEERRRNALIGAAAGAGAGIAASALLRAASTTTPTARLHASDPDVSAIAATIRSGERTPTTRTGLLSFGERQYQRLVNESYAAEKIGRMAGTGEAVKEAVAVSHGWESAAHQFLRDEFRPVLEAAKGREADVMALVKARRDLDLTAKGTADKTGLDKDLVSRARTKLEADPATAQAADALQAFYHRLQELKLDAGVISQAQFDAMRGAEDFYTPFIREWDDAVARVGSPSGGKNVQRGTATRKMDREQQARAATVDPFEVAVHDAGETFRAVAKQRVTNAVVSAYTAAPDAVGTFLKPLSATEAVPPSARGVEANVGGTRQRFAVTDPDLYDAWGAFDQRTQNLFMRFLSVGKRTLQTGVTILPDFAAANLARDVTQAGIQQRAVARRVGAGAGVGSVANLALDDQEDEAWVRALKGGAYGSAAGVLGPQVVRTLKAMGQIIGDGELYRQFRRDGGMTMGFYPRDPQGARRTLERLRSSGVSLSDVVSPRRWVDALQTIGSVAEQSTRLAKYGEVLTAGGTKAQAALSAQDVSLRFSQVGADTKSLASVTAFWNAKVQGWDKLARMLKNPRTWAVGVATITAPTLALWETNKDNPEYWTRPQWERNLFWLVPKDGGGFWRIPKPFEIGFLFASLPERLADYAAAKRLDLPLAGRVESASPFVGDVRPGETTRAAVADMLRTTADGTLPLPTLPMAALEQLVNFDLFRNRRIVTRPDLPVEQQQDEFTSSAGVAAGEAGVSPQRFDKAVRDLFGSAGSLTLQGIDQLARSLGYDERPIPPGRRPFIGRFETQPGAMSDAESTVRRRFEGAERAYRGYTNLQRQGVSAARLRTYVESNRDNLEEYAALNEHVKRLDKVRDLRREALRRRGLSVAERTRIMDQSALVTAAIAERAIGGATATVATPNP